jgi:hypothetical protein
MCLAKSVRRFGTETGGQLGGTDQVREEHRYCLGRRHRRQAPLPTCWRNPRWKGQPIEVAPVGEAFQPSGGPAKGGGRASGTYRDQQRAPLKDDRPQSATQEHLRQVRRRTPRRGITQAGMFERSDGCQHPTLRGITDRSDPAMCSTNGGIPTPPIAGVQEHPAAVSIRR